MKQSGCSRSTGTIHGKIRDLLLVVVLTTVVPTWGFCLRHHHLSQRCTNRDDHDTRACSSFVSIRATVTTTTSSNSSNSNKSSKTKEERFVEWMTTDCWNEVPHPGIPLTVQGHIPSYVHGTYIKNGPGAMATRIGDQPQQQRQRYTHAFDGLAKLQKFDIDPDGSVTFTTRFIDSQIQRGMMHQNRIPGHLAVGPVEPPFAWWDILWHTLDFDNTSVNFEQLSQSNVYCAVTDAVVRNQIHLDTLETVGRLPNHHIQGMTGVTQFSTAHSKISNTDHCTYNYYLEFGLLGNYAHMVRTNHDLTQTSIGNIRLTTGRTKFPYVHEISVSENYAILVLPPLLVNLSSVLRTGCLLPTLEYKTQQNTLIVLFDLHQVQPVQIFEAPPCWCYHHANAYEDVDNNNNGRPVLILDLIAYDTPAIANGPHGYLYPDKNMRTRERRLQQEREGTLWRYKLDLSSSPSRSLVQPEIQRMHDPDTGLPLTLELVSVSPDRLGRPYRYLYGLTGFHQGRAGYMDWAILKQDVQHKERHGVWYQEYMYPGEVTFVPNKYPNGGSSSSSTIQPEEEDDGVLLSTVYDSLRGENFLLVLDASNMSELARAYTGMAL
jgi:beta,beta-carotene 9',10'-dioxygenase